MEINTANYQSQKLSGVELKKLEREIGDINLEIFQDRDAGKKNLGKEDFLRLLVKQIEHQDPLEPMKNTESIAQMAQFSALEQMQNVSQAMESLAQRHSHLEAQSMLGKRVEYHHPETAELRFGVIDRLDFKSDGEVILSAGGQTLKLDDIKSLSMAPERAPQAQAAMSAYQNFEKSTNVSAEKNNLETE